MKQEGLDFSSLRVIRTGPSGRRSYEPEDKRKLIAACRQPGASVSKLASRAGIKVKQLHNWLAQDTKRSRCSARDSAFVPVLKIDNSESRSQPPGPGSRPNKLIRNVATSPIRLMAKLGNGVSIELHCKAGDTALVVATLNSLGAR